MSDSRVSSPRTLAFWAGFAATAGVLYVAAMELNWAAFTYHPRLGEWAWGVERPRSGPAMYWYGWLATAALGGSVAGAIAAALSRAESLWFRLGWIVPAAAMVAAVYFMIPFFTAP